MQITRPLTIPDPLRVSRYQKNPELGPRILFFSGGSALNGLSRKLKQFTHNSIHLVPPYDSGGSSAVLRQAFDMPAIGDLRSRLMALADESILGHPDIYQLFNHRLDKQADNTNLKKRLENIIAGSDELTRVISNPMRTIICNHLGYFYRSMPSDFNLQGASIGNLILAGGYLNHHHQLDPIIFLFSELVNVRGTVRAITEDNYHLCTRLDDGSDIVGQHLFTGKEHAPISSPIVELSLSSDAEKNVAVESTLKKRNRKLIAQAELICFPPGSFFSSVLANLLPKGVAQAIQENKCPKVYVPNLGSDPEQVGMTLTKQIQTLLSFLDDTTNNCPLDFILVDSQSKYLNTDEIPYALLKKAGIQLIDTSLIDQPADKKYNSEKLVNALLSMT